MSPRQVTVRRFDPAMTHTPLLAARTRGHGNCSAYVEVTTAQNGGAVHIECNAYDVDAKLISTEGWWVVARHVDETRDPATLNRLMETLADVAAQCTDGESVPAFIIGLDLRRDGTVHPRGRHEHPYAREAAKRLRRATRRTRSADQRRPA